MSRHPSSPEGVGDVHDPGTPAARRGSIPQPLASGMMKRLTRRRMAGGPRAACHSPFSRNRPMDVRLVVVRGAKGRPRFQMRGPTLVIGRQKGCGLRVPAATVSREHCRLLWLDGGVVAEDLNSVNGTLVNGKRIDDRTLLHPG